MEEDDFYVGDNFEDNFEDEDETERDELLQDYKKYWQEQYDPTKPGLSLPASLTRERILKKPGEWEKMRSMRLPAIEEQTYTRKAKQGIAAIKSNVLCSNLSLADQKNIPKDLLIALKMNRKGSNKSQKVCYRLDNLYSFLQGRYGEDKRNWVDPETKTTYSKSQQDRIGLAFKELFPCSQNSIINIVLPVELLPKEKSHRIQIPEDLYLEMIQQDLPSPYIFVISNYPFAIGNRKVADSKVYFVGLEAISSHPGQSIRVSSLLMKEMNLKIGDQIGLKTCFGLPLASKLTLKGDTIVTEEIRTALEDLINNNYYALQVSEVFEVNNSKFTLTKITTTEGKNVLSAINASPGGLTLDLEIE